MSKTEEKDLILQGERGRREFGQDIPPKGGLSEALQTESAQLLIESWIQI